MRSLLPKLTVFFVASLVLAIGAVSVLLPDAMGARVSFLAGAYDTRDWLMRGYGLGLIAVAGALLTDHALHARALRGGAAVLGTLVLGAFYLYCQQLGDWWIDDAGITFSYARSLADGAGVTFAPGEPPTEGYSSTVWMLTLALAHSLGIAIPTAAKSGGIALALVALAVSLRWVWIETRSATAMVLAGAGIASAPFVIWASSGQEHALQGLLLLLAGYCAVRFDHWRLPVALLLAVLVLTRPETPLIVIAVFVAALLYDRVTESRWHLARNLVIALVPFAAFVGLMIWRLSYFGDPFPNPYYAKTSGSSFTGLLNLLGGGWRYLWNGLTDTGLLMLVPVAFGAALARRQPRLWLLFAVLVGHLFFVIWAKGDWMGGYRFLMPVLPLLVLPAVLGLCAITGPVQRTVLCGLGAALLFANTLQHVDQFEADPTTPLAVVSEIGQNFAKLSARLGIDDPLLAHHDAGAISFERSIRLVDLGGLVNRDVAKNMSDAEFLRQYVLEQQRPSYVFGARNFAAASGFLDGPELARDYVRLSFPNHPIMDSDYSYIRRDLVAQVPGVVWERDARGQVQEVVVITLD